MEAVHADFKHVRLVAQRVPNGWAVGLWDLNTQRWIVKGAWIHTSRADAQRDAKLKAAALLGEALPELVWEREQPRNDRP